MDEGIGSKIKRIMHSYQLLFSNVTSKAKSTRHVYIYKMTCMFLTTLSLSPFRIPGLWMQVYILCLSSSRSSFNPFSFYRRGLQEQGTMMVDFMPYASLTVCIIYIFQLFWLCHWLFGYIMRKMKKLTSRTVSAQLPTDQAWSLVRLRVSISLFFSPVSDFEQRGGGGKGLRVLPDMVYFV